MVIQDRLGFWILRRGFQISIVREILDFLAELWITKPKFPEFRNPDSLTFGNLDDWHQNQLFFRLLYAIA